MWYKIDGDNVAGSRSRFINTRDAQLQEREKTEREKTKWKWDLKQIFEVHPYIRL